MNMKKWNLNLISAVLWITAATMFTSCLEGGKNTYSDSTIGIIRFDTKTFKSVLDIPGQTSFYSPAFDSMLDGACCYVVYEIDMNAPENTQEVLQANGYYTVTVSYKEEIDKYSMQAVMTDTTKLLTDETAISNPNYSTLGYLNGVLFLVHQLKKPSDQRTVWSLSYDPQNMSQDDNGRHVYHVYLRSTIRIAGTKSPEDSGEPCAYEMKNFMETAAQNEKNAGSTLFYIRFHYVSEIKDDVLTWNYSDINIDISAVLPATTN
jgi:hypothetical protein